MAKATSKEQGATARTRAASDSLGAKARATRAASEDQERDDEELEAQESTADATEAAEADEASMDLALPDTYRQDLTAAPAHVPARARTVPTWAMANPVTRFIAESYLELLKVTWPTVRQAWIMTLVVVAMSAFVALLLAAADFGLIRFLTWVLSLASR